MAKQSPEMAFTSLAYRKDLDGLKEANRRTRKDGAAGVDGVTAEEYEKDLEGKLRGHYAYYRVTGFSEAMNRFRQEVENRWRKWLNRRSRIRSMHWQKFCALLRRHSLAPSRAVCSKLSHAANP